MGAMLSWLKTDPMVAALIFCSYGTSRQGTSAILRDLFEASFFLRSRAAKVFSLATLRGNRPMSGPAKIPGA
jgi:hypothetical protein